MMNFIKKELRQNLLIQEKIRKASFVKINENTEKFKYKLNNSIIKYFKDKLIVLKTIKNKLVQKPKLWLLKVDFNSIRKDFLIWVSEGIIEGLTINFIFWVLFGWKFTLLTILAWGFAIKQFLSIYWRLRINGTNTKIFKKN